MMRLALALIVIAGCSDRRAGPRGDAAASGPTSWSVQITDGKNGPPIAGRVVLFDAANQPVRIGTADLPEGGQAAGACALADGALGTVDGILLANGVATIPIGADACTPSPAIPYGRYLAVAWRGPEHEIWDGEIDLRAGRGQVDTTIALTRVWTPERVLAADLHVHAQASTDSLVPLSSRVVAQVAAGVQVIGLSDHHAAGDLDASITALGLGGVVTSIASSELGGGVHLGVYPWPAAHRVEAATLAVATIDEVFAAARDVPDGPIVQLDHPRHGPGALYDDTGWDGASWPPPFPLGFDAVEVLSGTTAFNAAADRRLDQSITDFYALIDHGFLVTAVGNSDAHHLDGIRDAVARNYVAVDDDRLVPLDEAGFVDAIRRRRVWTTTGPILTVEVRARAADATGVGPGGALAARRTAHVSILVTSAEWALPDFVHVRVGGRNGPEIVKQLRVPRGQRAASWNVPVALGAADTWIGVDTIGAKALPALITGSYLGEGGRGGGVPVALINPILVDVDGDGWWRRKDGQVKLEPGRAPIGGRASLRRPIKPAPRKPPPPP